MCFWTQGKLLLQALHDLWVSIIVSFSKACLSSNHGMYVFISFEWMFELLFIPLVGMVAQRNCCPRNVMEVWKENEEEEEPDTSDFWA